MRRVRYLVLCNCSKVLDDQQFEKKISANLKMSNGNEDKAKVTTITNPSNETNHMSAKRKPFKLIINTSTSASVKKNRAEKKAPSVLIDTYQNNKENLLSKCNSNLDRYSSNQFYLQNYNHNYCSMLAGNVSFRSIGLSRECRENTIASSLLVSNKYMVYHWSIILIIVFLGEGTSGWTNFCTSNLGSSRFIKGKITTLTSILLSQAFLLQRPVMTAAASTLLSSSPSSSSTTSSSNDELVSSASACDENDNEHDACSNVNNKEIENDKNIAAATIEEMRGKPHPEENQLRLFHYQSTTSTQDEATKIAKHLSSVSNKSEELDTTSARSFCVTSTIQSNGKGTNNRKWIGSAGNVHVTIGIPANHWFENLMRKRNIPLTLLPLKVGDLTASLINATIHQVLSNENNIDDGKNNNDNNNNNNNNNNQSRPKSNEGKQLHPTVTVKWPNDVLVDGKKIAGTLIESKNGWFLIGIGINVASAPTISTTGKDYGRPSVCINDYKRQSVDDNDQENEDDRCIDQQQHKQQQASDVAHDLGVQLALDFHRWIYTTDSDDDNSLFTSESIVKDWKRWLDWDMELTMRNEKNPPLKDECNTDEKGASCDENEPRVIKIVDVLPDGRIRVQDQDEFGKMEVLVSDYFI